MELNLKFYWIYSNSYKFLKFETIFEKDLNNSEGKWKMPLLLWAWSTMAFGPARKSGPTRLGLLARAHNSGGRGSLRWGQRDRRWTDEDGRRWAPAEEVGDREKHSPGAVGRQFRLAVAATHRGDRGSAFLRRGRRRGARVEAVDDGTT
jgi:hypothetical protein